ncbi:cyclin-dependent kinase F-4-like [Rutidosis leptorrhynchoides]|uniref:cyclin-dependent kinase F-4-like n=1 Tax=Rutidosis leptorrhynchoides TaxID=125765 RepID=UPI003A98F2F0
MERYQRLEALGEGAFGVVCKALDRKTNEIVAVKRMKDDHGSFKECMNLIEVKSLLEMNNHPNIIKLKEIHKKGDILYLIFEYMECSLYDRLKNQTEYFSETQIKSMCFQLFQGLAYAHAKGYIHRDLKPGNILVSKDVIKICDFGQAREIDDKIPFTDYVTTRWYRAPEVILGQDIYDFSVDMWAMGTIMVELYNRKPLFDCESGQAVLCKICKVIGTPTESTWKYGIKLASEKGFEFPKFSGVKLSELVPTASPEAVDLIGTLLSWNPHKRGTAMEVLIHPFFKSCRDVLRSELRHERSLKRRKCDENEDDLKRRIEAYWFDY